jgi:hypothetical protein
MRSRSRWRAWRDIVALYGVFTGLALAYTWPLALALGSAFPYPTRELSTLARADLNLMSWILSWGAHQVRHDPLHLFDANILHPFPRPLAFADHMLAGVLLVLPVDLVHHNPVLNSNLLLLASFVLGGVGTALLVRELGATLPAATLSGALFAFGPLRWAQLIHIQALSSHWMPFTLLLLHRFLRTGRWTAGLGFAATLLLTALSSMYHLYYFGLAVVLFLGLHAVWGCPVAPRAYRRTMGLMALVAILIAPTLLPYAAARADLALVRDPAHATLFAAVAAQYLGGLGAPLGLQPWRAVDGRLVTPLLGLGTAVLAFLGAARGTDTPAGGRRVAGLYACLALALALVSLGQRMRLTETSTAGVPGPHALLAAVVPGFDALRLPQRAAAGALLAWSVMAGLGAQALLERVRFRASRIVVGTLLAGVVLLECWRPAPYVTGAPLVEPLPAVYDWLAAQPGDVPILEIPVGGPVEETFYMLRSTYHWKRLVNGRTAASPGRPFLQLALANFPDERSLRLLRTLRVAFVVVHRTALPADRASVCSRLPEAFASALVLRYQDAAACVFAVVGAPATVPVVGHPISMATARLTTSSGEDASAAADGDVGTHWTQRVLPDDSGWLQIELPEARPVGRVVVRLGSHFGEYLRAYDIRTSLDGEHWEPAAQAPIAEPPLAGLLTAPQDLRTEAVMVPRPVRYLRLVRPPVPPVVPTLYMQWGWWGVHEIELYEDADGSP